MNNWQLHQAVRILHQGGVLAYPTEAVWGLGCDPWNADAVRHILRIKRRPEHKGLILVAANMEQLHPLLAPLTQQERERMAATWPGPNTWLIPDPQGFVPTWVKGHHASVAVRVSDHPLVQRLCSAWGRPLISTSANPASYPPARDRLRVMTYFGSKLDLVVHGQTGGYSQPSTIRSLHDSSIIRP